MVKVKESQIQSAIEQFLQLHENLGHLVYQKNNTGAIQFNRDNGQRGFMRFGKKGAPDFLVWCPHVVYLADGHPYRFVQTVFLEVKTEKGRLSEGQRAFEQMVLRMGGHYHVVRSFDEAKDLIDIYRHDL